MTQRKNAAGKSSANRRSVSRSNVNRNRTNRNSTERRGTGREASRDAARERARNRSRERSRNAGRNGRKRPEPERRNLLLIVLVVIAAIVVIFGVLPRLVSGAGAQGQESVTQTSVTQGSTAQITEQQTENSQEEAQQTASSQEQSDAAQSGLAETEEADSAGTIQETAADETASEEELTEAERKEELEYPDRVIRDGIRIDGVDVSGLTEAEAREQIQADVDQKKQAVVTLQGREDDQTVEVTAGELGLTWANPGVIEEVGAYGEASNVIARYKKEKDLENHGQDFAVKLSFDKNLITGVLNTQCASFNEKAVDATLQRNGSGFEILPGQSGHVVNVESSADKIYNALKNGWDGSDVTIELDIEVDEPKGTEEDLAQIKDVLGTYTTSYTSSGTARSENIANGTNLISGHVLYPGEEFSVLDALVPFTEENGYYLAGSYLGGQVVDSLGGGICQVSTTLYNALIRAELEITERYNHTMIVTYVEPSMDAAIAESSGMDLKFRNNTDYPIYVEGYTENKSVTFTIYGVETRDPSRKVTFESEILSTTEPTGEKIYTDASQPVGYIKEQASHTGYKARLWKIVEENGEEISREVFNNSTYQAEPRSATVGTAGTVSEALAAAIEANSIEGVKAALSGDPAPSDANTQLAEQAQEAAQQAYAAALAQGADQASATAAAQAAANQVVAAQTGQSVTTQTTEGGTEQTADPGTAGTEAQTQSTPEASAEAATTAQ